MNNNEAKDLISGYLPYYLQQKGIRNPDRKFACLNPNHADSTPSMLYDRKRNKCHCFSCGVDVDIFDLIAWDYGTTNFKDTMKVARELFGIDSDNPVKIKPVQASRKKDDLIDINIRDKVYRTMRDLCPLTEEDIRYLAEVRGIPKDRAVKRYFRMSPAGHEKVVDRLKKLTGYSNDILQKVPGFFVREGKLDFRDESGIAILIYDVDGKVSSVQIRRDTADKGSRYCWFSSKYVIGRPGYEGGASPGSQKDVLIPSDPKKTICITEGRFKSEILASYGNIAVSVQGVSSWKGIESLLSCLMDRYDARTVYLMFDSDILGNYQVFRNIRAMVNSIRKKLPELKLVAGIWQIQYGKGIDDCILAGNMDKIRFVDAAAMLDICDSTYHELMKKKPLPSEVKDTLQRINESVFFPQKAA